MRKLVLKMHVSLREWEVDGLERAGVHIMGRVAYGDMAAYWPTSEEPYAPPLNETPKVVFSKSLSSAAGWAGSRVERADLAAGVAALKREPGKELLAHGGARFAQSLSRHGLIDEYRLVVHPVALGAGLRLFSEPVDMELRDVRRFPAGAIALIYDRGPA